MLMVTADLQVGITPHNTIGWIQLTVNQLQQSTLASTCLKLGYLFF